MQDAIELKSLHDEHIKKQLASRKLGEGGNFALSALSGFFDALGGGFGQTSTDPSDERGSNGDYGRGIEDG